MTVETVVLLHATRGLQQLSRNAPLQPPAPWKYVYAMAYGVPLVVVAVSVGMRPDAYGSEQCWLSRSDGFIWSFTGSLLVMFGVNAVLFMVIFIILRLSECPDPNVSYASGLTLKAVFQFVILSLPWILGIVAPSYEGLEILVILLHSQQGSCLFIMHCVFNAEVRRQYERCWQRGLRCPSRSDQPAQEFHSIAVETAGASQSRQRARPPPSQREQLALQAMRDAPPTSTGAGQSQLKAPPPGQSELKARPPAQSELKTRPPGQPQLKARPPGQPQLKARPPGQPQLKARPPSQPQLKARPPGQSEFKVCPPGESKLKARPPGQSQFKAHSLGQSELKARPPNQSEQATPAEQNTAATQPAKSMGVINVLWSAAVFDSDSD
ncbi:uncharacterized protein LOC134453672 [Engraulis encrasicolus]|uniref:uncharacterized protein LOC134453672 n=1 Tax=Engraulis encrasicolus TaxID=184585 RepID=UPI002FD43E26